MAKLTGTNPEQVPTNADLGDMAYQSKDNASISKIAATPLYIQNGTVDYSWSPNARTAAIIEGGASFGTVLSIVSPATGYSGIFFGDDASEASGQLKYDHTANKFVISADGGGTNFEILSGGTVLVGNGLLELDGNDIGGTQVTIADDAVATITPPRKGGFMVMFSNGTSDYPTGYTWSANSIYYDVGASLSIQSRDTYATNVEVTTSDVTGTTGTDAKITVAAQTGVIKIENRYGGAVTFQITFL